MAARTSRGFEDSISRFGRGEGSFYHYGYKNIQTLSPDMIWLHSSNIVPRN